MIWAASFNVTLWKVHVCRVQWLSQAEEIVVHCILVIQISSKRAAQERHNSTELAIMWLPPWAVVSMRVIHQYMYTYICRSISTFHLYIQIHTYICEVIWFLLLSQPWRKGQAGWKRHSCVFSDASPGRTSREIDSLKKMHISFFGCWIFHHVSTLRTAECDIYHADLGATQRGNFEHSQWSTWHANMYFVIIWAGSCNVTL